MSKNYIFSLILLFFGCLIGEQNRRKNIGVFLRTDRRLENIVWGNWGSRPYEYYWAKTVVAIKDKNVIDLGVGLPSQYTWYHYVIKNLKPKFYAGIDCDARIINEQKKGRKYEIKFMDMSDLAYPSESFDIAYCISTFEHIPYDIFMKTITEAYRVLTPDGLLVITLDEEWDMNQPITHGNGWNTLEQSLIERGIFKRKARSFGLPEFLDLIKDYFVLYQDDAITDLSAGTIYSKTDGYVYYQRNNQDNTILNSGIDVNSCVSYALLKKKI